MYQEEKRRWELKKEKILEEDMNKLVNIYINNHNIVNWISNNVKMRWMNCKEERKRKKKKREREKSYALFNDKLGIYENIIDFNLILLNEP